MTFVRNNLTVFAMVLTDMVALECAFWAACIMRAIALGGAQWGAYFDIATLLLLFSGLYAAAGLYPGLLLSGPDFLKRYTINTSLGFLFISMLFFLGQRGIDYSRFIFFLSWILSLITIPCFHLITRHVFKKSSWWGYPVVLMGPQKQVTLLAQQLRQMPQLGFHTQNLFFTSAEEVPSGLSTGLETGYLLPGGIEANEKIVRDHLRTASRPLAVLALDGLSRDEQQNLFHLASRCFKRIIILPEDMVGIRLSLSIAVFCTRLAFSLRQNLLDPYRLHMKRLLDLLIILIGLVPLVPVILLIMCAVFISDPGPVFYRQKRVGQHGQAIRVWKFRTMVKNADTVLETYLQADPKQREEWRQDHKLKQDPRITRVGHFLRKYSLDELPQLFNVLMNEMSLVGPRPIVEAEIPKYGAAYEIYTMVKPGITGLWQVSGRNNTTYGTRVTLDEYYIANWSVWQDIYIILRTIPAAIFGRGAY